MPKIKICGFMNEADIDACLDVGVADILGFVTEYPLNVAWNLSRERACELIKYARSKSKKIECAIVTGGESQKLLTLTESLRPDYVQLHYKENSETITRLKEHSFTKIIKTVPHEIKECLSQSGESSIEECAKKFEESGADMLLVDSRQPSNVTEKSKIFDAKLFERVRDAVKIPVMLAGGITPDNIKKVYEDLRPSYIDIMTGVEDSPGQKSRMLLEKLRQVNFNAFHKNAGLWE